PRTRRERRWRVPTEDLRFVDETVQRLGRQRDAVIPILQALQEHYRYLPEPALRRVCEVSEITPSQIWGISTFYDQFRHQPVGKHVVHVCHGTACHVSGADRVEEALRRHLKIPAGADTDPEGNFTIEPVACLGCCTLAPVVRFDQLTTGLVNSDRVPAVVGEFLEAHAEGHSACAAHHGHGEAQVLEGQAEIRVGLGSCCMAKGSDRLFAELHRAAERVGVPVRVKRVGCVGMCHETPLIEVVQPGRASQFFSAVKPSEARQLVFDAFRPPSLWGRITKSAARAVDRVLLDQDDHPTERCVLDMKAGPARAFLGRQVHIASEHFGKLDPLDLEEYLRHDGFAALRRCLVELKPDEIIDHVTRSGLRGRGGAGFPTGPKWAVMRRQVADQKYVICNGDEGDPGAFMDRMLLESFPYRIIEGLAISALATGATEGIFYVRREYPLAVERIQAAIDLLEKRGWLGDRLLGTPKPFRVYIKEGAGAFVCGEETALIASIEGRRGMPRLRPPFPAESGLWDKPTLINNVETLACVPWILRRGGDAFAAIGTKSSKGTKVFALAGKVQRGGLIEVPMGTTIREIVDEIGGGVTAGRRFKAVQIGGPSGGCVPASLADTPVDYESLREVGAIMGSGGLVVLDDTDCMVDIARYFLKFTQDQSCGKCTFCRVGTRRMLDLLELICAGKGRAEHIVELERLAHSVGQGSLCGLGKTAPNPVVTTLKYFRDEYDAHLQGRCPSGKCQALIRYEISSRCTGCTVCSQQCPVDAIPLAPYERHRIDQSRCTKCDTCRNVCPYGAVEVH
ncbi:MAG: NAD(P)H-dependent oxidoreductase subunit E, partial [Verrucomicrobiales bacterium]|nr:NAD(P)H-dependent oxidoreductase subunit E [Verrucomicrobiales bacterium]